MAISLANKPNVTPPGGAYPFGNIKDDTGLNDGTPLNSLVHADFHQFFSKLLSLGAVTPNELLENNTNGFQYHTALNNIIAAATATKADKSTILTAGTGLSGGGDLSANRTLSLAAGAAAANLGAAGGDLTGTFPSPTVANGAITAAKIAVGAAVGNIANGTVTDAMLASTFNKVTTYNFTTAGGTETAATIATTASKNFTIEVVLVAKWVSGGGNAAGDGSWIKIVGNYKNVTGVLTLIGVVDTQWTHVSSGSTPNLSLVISGSNILVQVATGAGGVFTTISTVVITQI